MKNIVFKFFLIIFVVFCFFCTDDAEAALGFSGIASGEGAWSTSCGGSARFCYNSAGLRVSLYKLNGTSATKIGYSHDFWRKGASGDLDPWMNARPRIIDPTSPKVDVINKKTISLADFSLCNLEKNYSGYGFNCNSSNSIQNNNYITKVSRTFWEFDYTDPEENTKFVNWLLDTRNNEIFKTMESYELLKTALGISEAQKQEVIANPSSYYIVVEVLYSIWVRDDVSFFKGGFNYVGSLYELNELARFFNSGIEHYSTTLYVSKEDVDRLPSGDVLRNFVGRGKPLRPIYSTDVVSYDFVKKGQKNAIGLSVFKLSDIIQERTCQDECHRYLPKDSSDYLSCASNYCETMAEGVDSTAKKRQCLINQCKLSEPSQLSCNQSCPATTNTECDDDMVKKGAIPYGNGRVEKPSINLYGSIKSCKLFEKSPAELGGDYYYKVSCDETNKVFYPDTLPTTLGVGVGGFNYSLKIDGKKECTFKFNADKYKFDKASLYGDAKSSSSSAPEKAKKEFQNLTKDNVDSFAKYNNDFNVTLEIGSTEEALVTDPTKTNSTVDSMTLANGMNNRTSKSTGTTTMVLQPKCYSIKTGAIYMPPLGSDCSYDGNTLYNSNTFGYFSTETDEYKTITNLNITKENPGESCDLANDKCYFYKDDATDENNNADCVLSITDFDGNEADIDDGYYKENIRVTYNHLLYDIDESDVVAYCLEGSCNNSPNKFRNYYVPASGVREEYVSASIKYKDKDGNTVVKSCPVNVKLKNNPTTTTDKTCTEEYEPTQYEAINNYCATEYNNDRKKYANSEECINDCSNSRVICKLRYTPNELDKIINYCNNHYSVDGSGYDSAEQCINDCSDPVPKTNEYIYRPIALGGNGDAGTISFNAFPNRIAGSNWIGYESKYTATNPYYSGDDPKNTNDAIYIIELDSESIREIRSDTRSKGKEVYFYNDEHDIDSGKYISKLIDDMPDVFICRNGSGSCSTTTEGSGW